MNNINKQNGSTLIQVLITLVIASIAVIAMGRVSMIAMSEGNSNSQRMSAIIIAQTENDNIRYDLYKGSASLSSTVNSSGSTAKYKTVNAVTNTDNGGTTATMRNIVSTSTWTDSSGMANTVKFTNNLPLSHEDELIYGGLLIMQYDGSLK